jgi:quercetin dioxygenase-like cupin family protein
MQTEYQTHDDIANDAAIENVYKKITKGQEIDVHTVLVPKGKRVSLRPYKKERVVILSMGTVVVKHGETHDTFRAPSHFILPCDQAVDIFTLEDIIWYGIDHHDQNFVTLDEQSSTTEHFFTQGIYAKKITVPAGTQVPSHKHVYDHLSILAQGRVRVTVGPITKEYVAPAMIEIKKNIVHTISAMENSVWFCVHATDATDVQSLESTVIVKD